MKSGRAAAMALVGSAAAQSVSYTTVTLDCPTTSMQPMVTITEGITATYCPACEASTPAYTGPGYTTTYTTTYMSLCPTGLVPVTHTITESCTAPTPTWTPGSSHIPPGFTVTTMPCSVCGPKTTEVTVTQHCGCDATEGVVAPTPVPTSPAPAPQCNGANCGASDNSNTTPGAPAGSPAPAPGAPQCNGANCGASDNSNTSPGGMASQIPDGQVQAPTGAAPAPAASTPCNGANCGAADNSNTSPSGAVSQIPDGQVQAPTGSAPAPAPAASSCNGADCGGSDSSQPPASPDTPVTAGASSISLGFASSIALAGSIAVLAFGP